MVRCSGSWATSSTTRPRSLIPTGYQSLISAIPKRWPPRGRSSTRGSRTRTRWSPSPTSPSRPGDVSGDRTAASDGRTRERGTLLPGDRARFGGSRGNSIECNLEDRAQLDWQKDSEHNLHHQDPRTGVGKAGNPLRTRAERFLSNRDALSHRDGCPRAQDLQYDAAGRHGERNEGNEQD